MRSRPSGRSWHRASPWQTEQNRPPEERGQSRGDAAALVLAYSSARGARTSVLSWFSPLRNPLGAAKSSVSESRFFLLFFEVLASLAFGRVVAR
jgi:hypothetical protein